MKELFNYFSKMIYPALILVFIFAFATAFVEGEFLRMLQMFSCFVSLIFLLLFLIGFIGKIVLIFKQKE